MRLRLAGAGAVVLVVVALAGCSVTFSAWLDEGVSKERLEQTISGTLEQRLGKRPDAVECPSGMAAEVGESIRCVLVAGQDRLGVTATVTEVGSVDVGLDIQVDDAPMGAAPDAAGATPPRAVAPQAERAAATVHPALVRVTGTFVGVVHNRQGAYANGGRPYTLTMNCSGFGVHPDGYLATAGHCVDANDQTLRDAFIREAAEEAVGNRTDVTLEEMIRFGHTAWAVEGPRAGSPVSSEIRVTGIPGAPPDGVLARVVDDRPVRQGDVALLKVDTTDLPALELATGSGIAVGTPVIAAGYPESLGVVGPDAQPLIKQGAVTEAGTDGGRPMYATDAAMEGGMSGGPAVDDSGRVLGINSLRASADLVIPISGFTDLLRRNGVPAELGPRDRLYREALDAYYAGEYTDALDALDRLSGEGPVHSRIDRLRADAGTAREVHGDASEKRMAQTLIRAAVGAVAIAVVVIGVVLLVRRQRRKRGGFVPPPYPPLPGPPAGTGWQGGPGGQFPAPAQPMAEAGVPHHPHGPSTPAAAATPAPPAGPTPDPPGGQPGG